ncbi:MAG TPA: sulfite exporter TauE/SafE family protein [Vicinamibacterales bacterium]|nr:sulfite exporter TauE/SafE family protein [Vicinamibacterales bacterium]
MLSSGGIALITFGAAIVNGALGYGFSSITVPLALFLVSNRVLNPALVGIEVALNAYVLWVNRASLGAVRRRLTPVVVGLLPGVVVGTLVVARISPAWVKFATYAALLPVILLQASGFRRPIRSERGAGPVFGLGLGALYSVTTISGPPLAVALNNQGFSKQEFRAAVGFVRLAESTMTAGAYLAAGLFSDDSLALLPSIVPSVAIGVPLGALAIRHLPAEAFRRICMSFDAWVVGFGLSMLLRELRFVDGAAAFALFAIVVGIDLWLLYRYFRRPVVRSNDWMSSAGNASSR